MSIGSRIGNDSLTKHGIPSGQDASRLEDPREFANDPNELWMDDFFGEDVILHHTGSFLTKAKLVRRAVMFMAILRRVSSLYFQLLAIRTMGKFPIDEQQAWLLLRLLGTMPWGSIQLLTWQPQSHALRG
ncbi:hypothetical protein H257_05044 [Aphanomyces astaci]|uniref:Uncharacterized protein n=1 Tax=Aphanomyces astaci TaxID=112090 RepID=W4GRR5_APHAT|nr:hypothetical protein H257_05044 [Aphanomyces astaci]ETV82392.1 hypothetical protein H257_05044 [Aphanomyces astaci]|eukprot:XP_009828061.1 hypothetical protein H257_05044 [Aphanomyces astaci]